MLKIACSTVYLIGQKNVGLIFRRTKLFVGHAIFLKIRYFCPMKNFVKSLFLLHITCINDHHKAFRQKFNLEKYFVSFRRAKLFIGHNFRHFQKHFVTFVRHLFSFSNSQKRFFFSFVFTKIRFLRWISTLEDFPQRKTRMVWNKFTCFTK